MRTPSAWNGSGTARLLEAVGDVLSESWAVLEAVPRPAAEEPPRLALRVLSEDEVRVAGQVVLADAGADDGCAGERREAHRRVVARSPLELRERQPLDRVGIDLVLREVGRDLASEPGDLTVAVEGGVVVAESGRAAPRAVGGEEEDVATRDLDVEQRRKELW